jgi:hypothetical protein
MRVKLNRPPKPEQSHINSNFNGKTIPYPRFEPGTSGLSVDSHNHCTIGSMLGFSIGFQTVFCTLYSFAKNPVFLNKNAVEKKPETRILFFNFSETFILKCTCTRTHDNINLFLRETRSVENKKLNFLFSMNEVNIETDLVVSKKKIYRFCGRIRIFYRRKTDLYEIKISVTLPSAPKSLAPHFYRSRST